MTSKTTNKGRGCTVCRHKDRVEIERLHVAGLSLDALSAKFGMSRDAIHRHCKNHLTDDMRACLAIDTPIRDLAERAVAENGSLLGDLSLVKQTILRTFLTAAALNDRNAVANLGGRAVDVIREIGKLTGQISNITSLHQTVNFASTPEFGRLQDMVFARLALWPEALAAMLDGLAHLDAPETPPATNSPPMALLGAPQ